MNDDRVTYFAETDARNKRVKFGIKAKDRTKHVYVIGKTGMGKSTLLENMAVQDIANGDGMAFIDPHGKTADLLLEYVPKERIRDVIYIAPFDVEYPISFNVLESVDPQKRHLVVSGLMSTFKKIWVDAWSARMEYILTNTLLALLEYPGSTLLGVNRMLSDKEYRKEVVSKITDPSVKAFWVKEFANYTERMAAEAVPAIQNKVGQFTANPLIRNMIGQPVSSFDFREAMDKRKIIIINLSKGKIGDENMKLLGGLLVTKIYLAAMSRADVPDRVMKLMSNFYLYVDEFQNFANASFADILSEARKYKLNLTIAHQYVEQMDEVVRAAVFGNVGTMITFRVGATDAELLEKEYAPQFTIEDLVNLGFAQIYLKLMINGLTSAPFSAVTIPPIPHPESSFITEIIASSREQFAKPRFGVEVDIVKFHESGGKSSSASNSTTAVPKSNPPTNLKTIPSNSTQNQFTTVSQSATLQPKTPQQTIVPKLTQSPQKQVERQPFQPEQKTTLVKPSEQTAIPSEPVLKSAPSVSAKPLPVLKPQVKPVPLSSLAQKNIPKVDHKIPDQKNVNDLKSALAAVLGNRSTKNEENTKPGESNTMSPTILKVPIANPAPVSALVREPILANQGSVLPQNSPQASVSPDTSSKRAHQTPPPTPTSDNSPVFTHRLIKKPPEEVPEDVLKKVLKVE